MMNEDQESEMQSIEDKFTTKYKTTKFARPKKTIHLIKKFKKLIALKWVCINPVNGLTDSHNNDLLCMIMMFSLFTKHVFTIHCG